MDDDEISLIVDRAVAGDLTAVSQLYELYYGRVYRYILARLQNVTEAEDLAGATFLRMVEKIGSFARKTSGGGFAGWLFTIAHNLMVDWWRARKTAAPLTDGHKAAGPGPEELAVESDSVREILKALDHLSDDQRQVLLLRLVGGLSCQETASVIGTTEGNVRALQHRGVQKLRGKLGVMINA